jgi:drug/metabolite transporter (DMT)-like permease
MSSDNPNGDAGNVTRVRLRNVEGIALTLFCVAIGGGEAVYVGNVVQTMDPMLLLLVCTSLIVVIFNLAQLRDWSGYVRIVRKHWKIVVLVNVLTCVAWGASFAALKFIEPALGQSATAGLVPISSIVFSRLFRNSEATLRSDAIASVGMLIMALCQIGIVWSGRSALGLREGALIGVCCIVVNGVANGAWSVFAKRLLEGGMNRNQLMAVRLQLIVIAGVAYVFVVHPDLSLVGSNLPVIAVSFTATVGVMYIGQAALQLVEPVTAMLILSLGPMVSFGFEWFDHRLQMSALSGLSTLAMVGFIAWSAVMRLRSGR